MGEIMLTIARVCRTIAVMTVTLAASLPFPEIAEAGNEGRPPRVGSYQHPRGNAHYQDHRGDRYQDHRSQQGDRNYGGAASSGTRIRCILPFCGNTFTPRGASHYQDHRAGHYQDHRNDPGTGRPPGPRDSGYQNPYMPGSTAQPPRGPTVSSNGSATPPRGPTVSSAGNPPRGPTVGGSGRSSSGRR
jgi:hypothetical protein